MLLLFLMLIIFAVSAPFGNWVVYLTFWRNYNTFHPHMVQKPKNRTDISNGSPRKPKPVTSLSAANFVT
jgi:hypothetical protein